MRCWVKSRNERNPYPYLPASYVGNYKETAGDKPEEDEDDVKSSWPLRVGLHACYNGTYRGKQDGDVEQIPKKYLSSDCSLQLESMKSESLVIVDQHATVNLYLGLVLPARHALEVNSIRSLNNIIFFYKFIEIN